MIPSPSIIKDEDALSYLQEAQMLMDIGAMDKSLQYIEEIKEKYHGHNPEVLARIYGGLARNYYKLGAYRQSVELWQTAVQIIKEEKNHSRIHTIFLSNLSNAFLKLGNNKAAEECLINSLAVQPFAQTYKNLSKMAVDHQDWDRADSYLAQGMALIKNSAGSDHVYLKKDYLQDLSEAFILQGYGYYHFHQYHYKEAAEYYSQVLEIAERLDRSAFRLEALQDLAQVKEALGHHKEAARLLSEYTTLKGNISETNIATAKSLLERVEQKDGAKEQEAYQLQLIMAIAGLMLLSALGAWLKYSLDHKKLNSSKFN